MSRNIFITSLCSFNDHLGVIDYVQAGNEETNHEVNQTYLVHAIPGVAEDPADHSVPEQAAHD